eukprot:CAMPEP_0176047964 /NCGR_PEP_ID=MMETSP0120_2-20121206/23823_1 /TAXON_ID=160619 /ORGANISM="Kryptoperidinium foliaceum, Strain CCMP 1326" /LENGTH=300 /DNA_ID=CAMNT_0017381379 /DNA_START=101 /DNA_END=1003 /DNA_ORIENTATION=-
MTPRDTSCVMTDFLSLGHISMSAMRSLFVSEGSEPGEATQEEKEAAAASQLHKEAPVEDDYDPRKPEFVQVVTEEEEERLHSELLQRQITRLESSLSRRSDALARDVGSHYMSVIDEMRHETQAAIARSKSMHQLPRGDTSPPPCRRNRSEPFGLGSMPPCAAPAGDESDAETAPILSDTVSTCTSRKASDSRFDIQREQPLGIKSFASFATVASLTDLLWTEAGAGSKPLTAKLLDAHSSDIVTLRSAIRRKRSHASSGVSDVAFLAGEIWPEVRNACAVEFTPEQVNHQASNLMLGPL